MSESQAMIKAFEEVEAYVSKRLSDLRSIPRSSSVDPNPEKFGGLDWRKTAKGFDWAFNTRKEGSQIPETEELAKIIEANNGKLVEEGFTYTISKDRKFLQRRRTKK